jgi:hypothetical protein
MSQASFNPYNLLLVMTATIFFLGILTFLAGCAILLIRAMGRDVQSISAQTAKLAQKGLAEEVAGLVGNASTLLEAMNQFVRTTAGIGVFLAILGLAMMGAACWLALQLNLVSL